MRRAELGVKVQGDKEIVIKYAFLGRRIVSSHRAFETFALISNSSFFEDDLLSHRFLNGASERTEETNSPHRIFHEKATMRVICLLKYII